MSQSAPTLNPSFDSHRQHINHLVSSALTAADPAALVRRHISLSGSELKIGSSLHHRDLGHILVVAVGKASIPMMVAATEQLGSALHKGIIITKSSSQDQLSRILAEVKLPPQITAYGAGHPLSDERSVSATTAVLDLVDQAGDTDLVLCLISGGASALLTQPKVPLEDWQEIVSALLASGCTINELNTVRKQLDKVKGGGLAHRAAPANCVSLILSDVVGNPIDMIGSGPTVPDVDPAEDVLSLLRRYQLDRSLPEEIWHGLVDVLISAAAETPPEKVAVANYIIGDVRLAAGAAVKSAVELGFSSHLLTANLEGEAREVGRVAAALAKDAPPKSCLVLGGETTVTLRGQGKGGRNQELALAAAIALDGCPDAVVVSFSTDGDDGPTDAAGAMVTGKTLSLARSRGVDAQFYLDNNDSYNFFSQIDGLIQTGQTGTNVNDLLFILKYEPSTEI